MKISDITISSFRGIPNKCSLSFSDKNGACSVILYGGNGSGKSSIIDSLEFALQARIGRSTSLTNPQRPKATNLALKKPQNSDVKVSFNDGTEVQRKVEFKYKKDGTLSWEISPKIPISKFNNVPIVLRRSDIIAFNTTKEAERQVLLYQFLYDANEKARLNDDPEVLTLSEEIVMLKSKRRELFETLSDLIKVPYEDFEQNVNLGIFVFCKSKVAYPLTNPRKRTTIGGRQKSIVTHDRYTQILKTAESCDKLSARIKTLQSQVASLKKVSGKENKIATQVDEVLKRSSKYLTTSFKKISNANYVKAISLSVGNKTAVSFNIDVTLTNGRTVSPSDIFSEANYDLLVLLLYLSIIRVGVDNGQPPIIILDDVLQSVDSTIRTCFVDYMLTEMKEWQIIFTCHDRLWLEQLKYLFNRKGHHFKEYHIVGWSFENGPTIREMKSSSMDTSLKDAIDTNNPQIISAVSGPFLEKVCNELSISLGCSVKRVRGDKYTLGDLWPTINKALKKTAIKEYAEKVDYLLYIRNLIGCHYNEWATSMSDEEIVDFANSIQCLYEKVFCQECYTWIHRIDDGGLNKACNCGYLSY